MEAKNWKITLNLNLLLFTQILKIIEKLLFQIQLIIIKLTSSSEIVGNILFNK